MNNTEWIYNSNDRTYYHVDGNRRIQQNMDIWSDLELDRGWNTPTDQGEFLNNGQWENKQQPLNTVKPQLTSRECVYIHIKYNENNLIDWKLITYEQLEAKIKAKELDIFNDGYMLREQAGLAG